MFPTSAGLVEGGSRDILLADPGLQTSNTWLEVSDVFSDTAFSGTFFIAQILVLELVTSLTFGFGVDSFRILSSIPDFTEETVGEQALPCIPEVEV